MIASLETGTRTEQCWKQNWNKRGKRNSLSRKRQQMSVLLRRLQELVLLLFGWLQMISGQHPPQIARVFVLYEMVYRK
jgi:drug/metabolite transporter superfamily protein YnfA